MRTQTTFSQDATFFSHLKRSRQKTKRKRATKEIKEDKKRRQKKGDKKSNRTTEANKLSKLINVREQSYL